MPAASISTPRSGARRADARSSTVAHIRWDRLGRVAMLCVLVAIAYLYLSAALSLLSTWSESKRDSALVSQLERQHHALVRQHAVLVSQGTLQTEARKLGMVRSGEQSYVVSGLPAN